MIDLHLLCIIIRLFKVKVVLLILFRDLLFITHKFHDDFLSGIHYFTCLMGRHKASYKSHDKPALLLI
jgi:hypothetical protein